MRLFSWLRQLKDKTAVRRNRSVWSNASASFVKPVEVLETRQLLAASLSLNGVTKELTITGTTSADIATVEPVDASNLRVRVVTGAETVEQTFANADVIKITFNADVGDDKLTNTTDRPISMSGGDGADSLIGGVANDTLSGGLGNDSLNGGGGDDQGFGGDGNDILQGGSGKDLLLGEAGNDNVNGGGFTGDTVSGGLGDDTIDGGAGTDAITEINLANYTLTNATATGLGNDTIVGVEQALLYGDAGNSSINVSGFGFFASVFGNGGDDTLVASNAGAYLFGGAGKDSLVGGNGNDRLFGQGGSFDTLLGGAGNDTLDGGTGSDVVNGEGGNDLLISEAEGNSTLTNTSLIASGTDTLSSIEMASIVGGTGHDIINVAAFGGSVTLNGGNGNDTLTGGSANDVLIGGSGNDSLGGGDGHDNLNASAGTDTVFGDAGNDTVKGDLGDDLLSGGAGNDTIAGGDGNDRLTESAGASAVAATLTNVALAGFGTDVISGIETAWLMGGDADDAFLASAFSGVVTLFGGNGNDTLQGGANDDVLDGGGGNNTLSGGLGTDRVTATGDVNFTLSNATLVSANTQTLSGIELASITGGAGANVIDATAFSGSVTLDGGAGNDTLRGSAANDSLIGGDGDDSSSGGAGNDTLDGGDGNDQLNGGGDLDVAVASADANFTLTDTNVSGQGTDVLTGIEQARITGGASANSINASAATTLILIAFGGGGNDTITGGLANDTLNGGDAADSLNGSGGDDLQFGDAGNDTVSGGTGLDSLAGGDGDDLVQGLGSSGDTLRGGLGNDTLDGGVGTGDVISEIGNVNFTLTATQLTGLGTDSVLNIEGAILVGGSGANSIDVSAFGLPTTLTGGTGNDSIIGGSGTDRVVETISGSVTLSDSLLSGSNTDSLIGIEQISLTAGSGHDSIDATMSTRAVTLNGGDGNDTLIGGSTADLISGGAGNDQITGNGGADALLGEDGVDRLIEAGDNNFTLGSGSLVGLTTDTISMFEEAQLTGGPTANNFNVTTFAGSVTLLGGDGNDTLEGAGLNDSLDGGTGDDVVKGELGHDTLIGGDGHDTMRGGAGNDSITGGLGNDFIFGEESNDTTITGDDTIDGGDGVDDLRGENGNDSLIGGTGNDHIEGGAGADRARGDGGIDQIFGGADNDTLEGNAHADDLRGDDGNDSIDGGTGDDLLIGGNGADILNGNDDNDQLRGGADNDALFGENGDDDLQGEDGNDTLDGSWGNEFMDGGSGDDSLFADEGNDTVNGGLGNDSINAGDNDDSVLGLDGDDTIDGYWGNDTINGGLGNDFIDAHNGNDSVSGDVGNDTIYGSSGIDTLRGNAGDDSLFGSKDADFLSGDDGADTLDGGLADDTLHGGVGNDTILGGDGNDELRGEEDHDSLSGDSGLDTVLGADGNDTLAGGNDADSLEGNAGNDSVLGDNGNDLVLGNDGDDTLAGGAGNDFVDASFGNDSLLGGDGHDQLRGLDGNDTIAGDAGNDTVQGQLGNDSLDGGAGSDIVLGDLGNDTALGGSERDVVIGDHGSDSINGGDGEDLVTGSATAYDTNLVALAQLLADWNAVTTYAERVTQLEDPNYDQFWKSLAQFTDLASLYDDYAQDTVNGGAGQDYFGRPGDAMLATTDQLLDRDAGTETMNVSVYGNADAGFFPANMTEPAYLATLNDPTFGTPITRVTGDAGTQFTLPINSGGTATITWSGAVRTRYVTDSSWNVDGSRLMLRSYDPAMPYHIVLNGETSQPQFLANIPSTNYRWSQNPAKPNTQYAFPQLNVLDAGGATTEGSTAVLPAFGPDDDTIVEYDVTTGAFTRTIELPFNKLFSPKTTVAFRNGHDYVAMFGVDKANPAAGISVYVIDLNAANGANPVVASMLLTGSDSGTPEPAYSGALDFANLWFSPDAQHLLVLYNGSTVSTRSWRLLDVNHAGGTITSHAIPNLSADDAFQTNGDRTKGHFPVNWSHPTFAFGPNGTDVYVVGVSGQFNKRAFAQNEVTTQSGVAGSVLAFNITNNTFHSLTEPTNENLATHVTATNTQNPGYVFVTFWNDLNNGRGTKYAGEIVAINLANPFGVNGTIELAHHRTNIANDFYHGNTLPNVSPDGTQLIFSSTWGAAQSLVETFVLDLEAALL